ncbi:MAG: bacteriochlorophyll 4-vinyl reductase [Roseococcus sp.]|nr:bacteriochlorophyll 4-vinyl reductase [Roseococcus sp.]
MAVATLREAGSLPAEEPVGRIGPNAVLQLSDVLLEQDGAEARRRIFQAAGLLRHLASPPSTMVEEREVARLFGALEQELGRPAALERIRRAGQRTAEYLLAHRIPPLARMLLPNLPASFAAVLLTRSIQRHGWTFLGSGSLAVVRGQPLGIRIRLADALARHAALASEYYRSAFEELFRALVHPAAHALPQPAPAGICRFDILW